MENVDLYVRTYMHYINSFQNVADIKKLKGAGICTMKVNNNNKGGEGRRGRVAYNSVEHKTQ